jgi:pimeloyl-ACP methyl ester carboxylesterase
MERAAGRIRDTRVVRLDGKGHWLLWECPDVVGREMRAFL